MRPASKPHSLLSRHWPYLFVVAAPAILFAPFLVGAQVFYWGTPLLQFYPWRYFALETIRAGYVPLWNPLLGNGAPLIANYQSAVFYPPNWLSLIAPLDLSLNWLLILHVMWAGVGMVTLARGLDYRLLGQAVAGLAFGMSQYVVARAGFYSINAAVAWLPWVIWAADRCLRLPATGLRPVLRHVLALALFVALQLLSGHAQTTWYTLLLVGAWAVWRSVTASPGQRRATILTALIHVPGSLVLAILMASVQLLPTAELLRQSSRAGAAGYEFVMTYSLSPWRTLTLLAPDLLGNPARGRFYGYGNYLEDAVYVGVLPLLLALSTIARLVTRRSSWASASLTIFLASILPVTLLLALGRNTPVFPFLYRYVPTFNLFQAPTRMMVWFVFALALLGGWAADHWQAPLGRALYWTRLGAAGAASVMMTCIAALALIPPSTRVNQQLLTVAGAVLAAGVNLLAAAMLSLLKPRDESRRWELLVAACLAADLVYASVGINPGAPTDLYRAPTATGPALARALGTQRLYQYPDDEYRVKFEPYFSFFAYGPPAAARGAREAQLPNVALLEGVASASNFDPLVSARYADFVEVISQTRSLKLLQFMDVGAVASSTPLEWPPIAKSETVVFYRVPGESRRAWVVYSARVVADAAQARAALADPEFDPRAEVILESDQPGVTAAALSPPPAVDARDPNHLRLEVTLERDGWVVLADTYYPGWFAWVDGRPVALRPANLAGRAVALPAGSHELVFGYEPESFRRGALLSGLSLAVWLIGALAMRTGKRMT